jgi:hypothetical protein
MIPDNEKNLQFKHLETVDNKNLRSNVFILCKSINSHNIKLQLFLALLAKLLCLASKTAFSGSHILHFSWPASLVVFACVCLCVGVSEER